MFHFLDLLSQLVSCWKEKKELYCFTFTTNSPEICLFRKEKIEYIVNFCLSKIKEKMLTKEKQQVLQVLIHDYNIENSILDSICSDTSTSPLSVKPWLASLVMLQNCVSQSRWLYIGWLPCWRHSGRPFTPQLNHLTKQKPSKPFLSDAARASQKLWSDNNRENKVYKSVKEFRKTGIQINM